MVADSFDQPAGDRSSGRNSFQWIWYFLGALSLAVVE